MTGFYFKPYPVLTVASCIALAILLYLGQWQLERRVWKLDLLDRLEARPAMDPVPLGTLWPPADPKADPFETLEFRPVTVTGRFAHGREMLLFGHQGAGRPGYFVITPLIRQGARPVLINRGFVPLNAADPTTRTAGQVQGLVTVTGLIRRGARQGPFTPDNEPDKNAWYWRDLEAMAKTAGLDEALPLSLDAAASATPQGGLPQGGVSIPSLRNNHLGYAITWFGFALCLVFVYGAYHRAQGRLGWPGGGTAAGKE